MTILDVPTVRRHTSIPGSWRTWNTLVVGGLTAYSVAIAWQAQFVSYPLYRDVPVEAFAEYHQAYNHAIPVVVIAPGFAGFLTGIAFVWTRPQPFPRSLAIVVGAAGAVALAATLGWAIPRHDQLDREGFAEATVDSLLAANLVRSVALTASLAALGVGLRRMLASRR